METTKFPTKIDFLPEPTKIALRNFLNNKSNSEVIKSQLEVTPVIIEDGTFQISIKSIEEFNFIIKLLNATNKFMKPQLKAKSV